MFEVGEHEGQVYLAMERVRGVTLEVWMAEETRGVGRVLAVFIQAARGLAAAHAIGLVHRDFKPANVLVSEEGGELRAQVTDFGLARPAERRATTGSWELDARGDETRLVGGTPGYMAPEQREGQAVDARADQFSYCVSLYEALYGERPFRDGGGAAYLEQVRAGIGERARRGAVPGWIARILARGLAAAPEERFPSMDALARALQRDPVRRRRARLRTAALVVMVGGTGWFWLQRFTAARPSPCADAGAGLREVWGDEARAEVERAFMATGAAYAGDVWARVRNELDAYAARWSAARVDACEDTHLRRVQSAASLDLRNECLARRRVELDALVGSFAEASVGLVERAPEVTARLGSVAACADAARLRRRVPGPEEPARRREATAIREEVTRLLVLERAGVLDENPGRAQALVERAEALADAPVSAEALLAQGVVQRRVGALEEAASTLERGLLAGLAGRHERMVARVAIELLWTDGLVRRRRADAERWSGIAEAALRASGDDPELRAMLLNHRGALATHHGEYARAEALHREALALRERALGSSHVDISLSLHNIGNTLFRQGRHAEARALFERSLALNREVFGSSHPRVAKALNNLAAVDNVTDRFVDAERELREALEIKERAFGPDHVELVSTLDNLATALHEQGRAVEGRAQLLRALALVERASGVERARLEPLLYNLALFELELDAPADAVAHAERSLELAERRLDPEHHGLVGGLDVLGRALIESGELGRAIQTLERGVAIAAVGEGASDEPILRVYERASVRSALADALARGGDEARALATARAAEAGYRAAAADGFYFAPEELAALERLIARLRP